MAKAQLLGPGRAAARWHIRGQEFELLNSTGQKRNSNAWNNEYGRKVQQRRPIVPPYVCSNRASSPGRGCWQDSGFQGLNRRWSACDLRKSPCHRSQDSCYRVITRPSWRAIPRQRLLPHLQVVHSRRRSWRSGLPPGAAPAGQGRAFADGRLGAWARRIAPMVSVRRGARRCAAPPGRRIAPWRSPARLRTRWCATGGTRRDAAHGIWPAPAASSPCQRPVEIRYGLAERGRDLIVAPQLLVRWGNAANCRADR